MADLPDPHRAAALRWPLGWLRLAPPQPEPAAAPAPVPRPLRPGRRGRRVLALVLLAVLATLVAGWLAFQSAPAIEAREPANAQDLQRALNLLAAHDPRRQVPGARRFLTLSARDLDLIVHHVVRRWPGARARVSLVAQQARVVFSAPVPGGRWLNLDLEVLQTPGLPRLHRLQLGPYALPVIAAEPVARWLALQHPQGSQALELLTMVQRVWVFKEGVRLQYVWDARAPERLLLNALSAPEQERLRAYVDNLARLTRPEAAHGGLSLCQLLASSFTLARERSLPEGDAAAENRAALRALSYYANRRPFGAAASAASAWPTPRPVPVRLAGREDLALHLLVSAFIAVEESSPLSRVIGVYKEVSDSRGGSGFSFDDLMADRVGTRLGEAALAQPRLLQQRLASCRQDDALMPAFADLPVGLDQQAFRERFSDVTSPAYRDLLARIDQRIDALPLWR